MPLKMADFQGLVTLTLDRVTLHTVMHHSSTSTYIPNFIEIEETVCGLMDGHTDGHLRSTLLGRVDLMKYSRAESVFVAVTIQSVY